MADYISREALIQRLNRNLSACNKGTISELCYRDAICTVEHLPTAEVEPVRRGERQTVDGREHLGVYCSSCNQWYDNKFNYCPNCGRKLDF